MQALIGLLVGGLNLYFALSLMGRAKVGWTEIVLSGIMAFLGISYIGNAIYQLSL